MESAAGECFQFVRRSRTLKLLSPNSYLHKKYIISLEIVNPGGKFHPARNKAASFAD